MVLPPFFDLSIFQLLRLVLAFLTKCITRVVKTLHRGKNSWPLVGIGQVRLQNKLSYQGSSQVAFAIGMLLAGWLGATSAQAQSPGGVSTGLTLWLKADAGSSTTVNNGAITGWTNKAPTGDLLTAAATQQPLYRDGTTVNAFNFNPSLTFDGVNDYFAGTSNYGVLGTNLFTAFSIGRQATNSAIHALWGQQNASDVPNRPSFYIAANNTAALDGGLTVGPRYGVATHLANSPFLVGVNRLGTTNFQLYNNGANDGTAGNIGTAGVFSGTFLAGNLNIGQRNDFQFNGDIAEQIIYGQSLSVTDLQKVNSYLAIKYGFTLDQTTPQDYLNTAGAVIWDKTSNSGYKSNIAGIGRDDAEALSQKQSKSINMGAFLSFGLGTGISASNALNVNGFSANNSYEIIGDNGLPNSYATAYLPQTYVSPIPSSFKLMASIWRVQETGTVGTITVSIPATSKAEILLVSNSATFTPGSATEITLTPDGNGNLTAQVDLTSGQYFTFGATVRAPGGVAASLNLWLKADAGSSTTTNNAATAGWTNQAPTGDLLTAVASQEPLYHDGTTANAFNYNPSLKFDGVNDYFAGTSNYGVYGTNSFTSFAIGRQTTANAIHMLWGQNTPGDMPNRPSFYIAANNTAGLDGGLTIGPRYGTATHLAAAPFWIGVNRSASTTFQLYNNGANDGTAGNIGVVGTFGGTFLADNLNIGKRVDYLFNGDMAEQIIYGQSLSGTDLQKVNSYLAIKYGFTLDQTTPQNYLNTAGAVIWDKTTNSGYKSDISGIGRDDAEALSQKQSKSINTGSVVTLGLGTAIATSNALNANTFTADVSYEIVGDNGLVASYATAYAPGSFTSATPVFAMSRIWKVQETGTVGTVTVSIPGTSTGTYLLVKNSPSFASGATEILMTSDGNGNLTAQVDLTDGQFFTFATPARAPGGVISGLNLWLKADAGSSTTSSGTATAGWTNQAPSGDLLTAAATQQPLFRDGTTTNAFNYNPTLDFDGVDDFFAGTSNYGVTGTNPFTAFSIGRRAVSNVLHMIWGQNTAGDPPNRPSFDIAASNNTGLDGGLGIGPRNGTATHLANTPFWIGVNRSASTTFQLYNNGASDGTAGNIGSVGTFGGTFLTNNLNIGKRVDYPFNGDLAEQIIYGQSLSASDLQKVNSYLAIKYGFTLDQTTPQDYVNTAGAVIWDKTANSGYKSDITGIGYDDAEGLNQKQSKSINASSVVTLGLGTGIAVSNVANINAFTADKSYDIIGDNGLPTSFSTAYTPSSFTYTTGVFAMSRIWKVQETGTVGTVTISIPGTSAGTYLLVKNSPSFVNGATEIAMTPDGNGNITAQVDLANGQFFTFATPGRAPGGILAGLNLWLRADAGSSTTSSGTATAGWTNQAPSGDLLTAAATQQPLFRDGTTTNAFNFNPSLDFDGVDDYFAATSNYGVTGTNLFTAFAIGRRATSTTIDALWGQQAAGDPSNRPSFYIATNNNLALDGGLGIGPKYGIATHPATVPFLIGLNRTASTIFQLYNNGANDGTAGNIGIVGTFGGTFLSGSLNIGMRNDMQFDGDIAEQVIYGQSLNASDLQKVNSYLALKYGFTLDQTIPQNYVNTAGAVIYNMSSYSANVTGIGRDDIEALLQNQSKSLNTNALVTLANGTGIAASNAINSNTFDADKSYEVIGDNGQPASYLTVYTPSSFSSAGMVHSMNRIWKVQETGTVGTVTISIPGNGQGTYLLVKGSPSFTSGATEILMTPDGNGNMTAQVDLTDGQYFTFGVAIPTSTLIAHNTYDMIDGLTPAVSPVYNPCFSGSQGIWQKAAVYKTGYTNGPVSSGAPGIAPGETASESTFIVDIDKDGNKDIVWLFDAGGTSDPAHAGVYIWKGNGDGTFATAAIKDIGTFIGNNGQQNGTTGLGLGGTSSNESTHIADMNGDGNLDLIWMYETTNSSYVWLGNGDGTFQHQAIFKTGYNGGPNGLLSIGLDPKESTFLNDIDNDGKIDVVWVYDGGPAVATAGVYIWKGNGDGTFATSAITDVASFTGNGVQNGTANLALGGITATESTHLADFNGDGKPDLIWLFESTNSSYVWLGNGDGTFQHTAIYKNGYTGGAGNVMSIGFTASENTNIVDADGDGKLDIVWVYDGGVAVATAGAYVWRGNGDGTFATAATKDIGTFTGNGVANGTASVALGGYSSTESTHVTDLNNDGKVDLLWLYENANSSYAWLAGCTQIAILSPANNTQASLNPVISGTATAGSTVVILGPGSTTLCTTVATSGTFSCPVSVTAGPQTLTAIASSANGVSTPATVSFTAVASLTAASAPTPLTVVSGAPTSGSAAQAIALSGGTAPLTYSVFNPGSGSATGASTVTTAHGIATINPTTGAYSYTATPGYSGTDAIGIKVCDSGSPQQCTSAVLPINVIAPVPAKQSNDGFYSDGVGAGPNGASCGTPQFWRHAPIIDMGTFTGTPPASPANYIQAGYSNAEQTFTGDVNGDGKADLIWVYEGSSSSNSGTTVWLGNGDGTFAHAPIIDIGSFTGTVPTGQTNIIQAGFSNAESTFLGDVNGDGKLDITWIYEGGGNSANAGTAVWLGNGNGTWSHTPIVDKGSFAFSTGLPGGAIIQAGQSGSESTYMMDVNGDGKLDVVWLYDAGGSHAASGTWTWLGNGNGTWNHTPVADVGNFATYIQAGANTNESTFITDVNTDGKPDVVYSNDAGGNSATSGTSVWFGNGDGTWNHTPVTDVGSFSGLVAGGSSNYIEGGLTNTESTRIIDVNGDGKPDLVWAYEGTSSSNSGTSVWLGNGDGTFSHTVKTDRGSFTGTPPQSIANVIQAGASSNESFFIVDLNNDGKLDIFWVVEGSTNGGTSVWLAGCTPTVAVSSPLNNSQTSLNPVISGTATPGSTVVILGPGRQRSALQ